MLLGMTTLRQADRVWKPFTEELVKEALEIVLDRTQHPVMLMCS